MVKRIISFVPGLALSAIWASLPMMNVQSPILGQWLLHLGIVGLVLPAFYWIYQYLEERKPKLSIVYLNECNKDHIQSLFKISTFFLVSGKPTKHNINFNEFYMGVQNNHTETINNVRCKIEGHNMPPQVIDASLVWRRNREMLISIPPKGTEYCLIGECFDDSDVGMFAPTILSEEQVNKIAHDVQARAHVGFSIITGDGGDLDLLKNDGYVISFSIYADNVESPACGIICINARSQVEVFVYPEGSGPWKRMKGR